MPTPGSTTARGYGTAHQALRRALIRTFTPGQPCPACGHPILTPNDADLGHTDDRLGYRGLEHIKCNRSDGARRGNKQRGKRSTTHWTTSRTW